MASSHTPPAPLPESCKLPPFPSWLPSLPAHTVPPVPGEVALPAPAFLPAPEKNIFRQEGVLRKRFPPESPGMGEGRGARPGAADGDTVQPGVTRPRA